MEISPHPKKIHMQLWKTMKMCSKMKMNDWAWLEFLTAEQQRITQSRCNANLAVLTNVGKYRFDVDAVNSAGGVPGGGTIRSLGFSSKILRNGWMSAVSLERRHGRYALLWIHKIVSKL